MMASDPRKDPTMTPEERERWPELAKAEDIPREVSEAIGAWFEATDLVIATYKCRACGLNARDYDEDLGCPKQPLSGEHITRLASANITQPEAFVAEVLGIDYRQYRTEREERLSEALEALRKAQ